MSYARLFLLNKRYPLEAEAAFTLYTELFQGNKMKQLLGCQPQWQQNIKVTDSYNNSEQKKELLKEVKKK